MTILNRHRLPHDAVESPLVYTKSRDIHAVGIVFLQMLMGRDVMERFPDVHSALRNCEQSVTLLSRMRLTALNVASIHIPTSAATSH